MNPYYNVDFFLFSVANSSPNHRSGIVVYVSDNLNIGLGDPFGSQCPPDTLTRHTAKGLLLTNFVYKIVCHHIMMAAFINLKIQIKH